MALVLELVEGEALDERQKRGPIPIEEALEVARQMAEGLEAAHEKGIVHRDLKPGNIKLTKDGGVPLRPIFQSAAFIAEGVPVFEIRDKSGMTDMLIRNSALGRALAETLANRNAVLMRGHGAVVVGPSLPILVRRSVSLDANAKFQAQAMALGRNLTHLDPEEARQILAREDAGLGRSWELWKKKALSK